MGTMSTMGAPASATPPVSAVELPPEVTDVLLAAALQNEVAKAALNFWVLGASGYKGKGQVTIERATFTPAPAATAVPPAVPAKTEGGT